MESRQWSRRAIRRRPPLRISQVGSEKTPTFDDLAKALSAQGHPIIRYELDGLIEAGSRVLPLGVRDSDRRRRHGSTNPFDQPDVQRAKDLTQQALDNFESDGLSPDLSPCGSLSALVADAKQGDYIAVLAYVEQTAETDYALGKLRSALTARYRVPTTLGYGPRYLHSTGQLHKGGPDSVAVLMLTAPHTADVEIPGEKFTFGVLADAQAASDLQSLRAIGRNTASVVLEGDPTIASSALVERL